MVKIENNIAVIVFRIHVYKLLNVRVIYILKLAEVSGISDTWAEVL